MNTKSVIKSLGLGSKILLLSLYSHNTVQAKGEITIIHFEKEQGTPISYDAVKGGSTKTYHWGLGENIKITGYDYDGTTFKYKNLADKVVIRRADNPQNDKGTSCSLFAERERSQEREPEHEPGESGAGIKGNSHLRQEVSYPFFIENDPVYLGYNPDDPLNCDMARVMGGRIINIGALDVFANGPNNAGQKGSFKDIERIDFIYTTGIATPTDASLLSQAGHVATEKSGNNPVKIAAILSLDAQGDPASYGSLVTINPRAGIHNNADDIRYGLTNFGTHNNFLSNTLNESVGGVRYINKSTENLGMAFISLEDLGVQASSTYYGFSYFGYDTPTNANLLDIYSFPLNSDIGGLWSPGQADMYGGVAGYFIDICLAFSGDVSEVSPALTSQVRVGDSIYIPSRTINPINGHLKAYPMQADGSISTTASWDAGTLMTAVDRQAKLWTTLSGAGHPLALFHSVGSVAATIKSYTLDPSFDSGAYLAGRESGSFLGAISRGSDTALLTPALDISRYLADADYQTFQQGTIASRPVRIFVNSDDGFLYAFDTAGALAWGWMPKSHLINLNDFNNFHLNENMRGKIDLVDAKHSGSYATYLVGGYKGGLGHYSLKLTNTGDVDANSLVWDAEDFSTYSSATVDGTMDYFEDSSGNTYTVYVVSKVAADTSIDSTIMIKNVADESDSIAVEVDFHITSAPYTIPDFKNNNAPASKTLYVGDSLGNIHAVPLLVSSGPSKVIDTAANLVAKFNAVSSIVGNIGSAEPILFLGASTSTSNSKYYLRAQSDSRLTLLKYNYATTGWNKSWTSYVTGAGTWSSDGVTLSADNSGPPTDTDSDGFATHVATGIQSLPTHATITDAAVIVADTIMLPISVDDSVDGNAGQCSAPKAYYYLYKLTDGEFPTGKFFTLAGDAIDEDLIVGYGKPSSIIMSDMPGQDKLLGTGNSDQDAPESTHSFYIKDSVSTGVRGWQEIGH